MLKRMHKYKDFAGLHIPDHVFEDIYATSSDPYGYTHRDYERQKRSTTLAALSRDPYMNAFEIGCSIGVLTGLLGERCDSLLSVDIVKRALQQARQRCAAAPNVVSSFQRSLKALREFSETLINKLADEGNF
jgi:protein-L-isoaspartate O-methyltransferase